ncbi:hypothetical protein [Tepidimicrobium xylanilyticum]
MDKNKPKDITRKVKPKLKEIVKKKGLELKDMVYVVEFTEEYSKNYEALEVLLGGNLIKEPEGGKCYFFENNTAWITQTEETHDYLYCSLNSKKNEIFYLNIVDFFIVTSEKNFGEIVTELLRAFDIETDEEKRKEKQRQKYLRNIEIIEEESCKWAINYPHLYKLTKATLNTLIKMNAIGYAHVVGDAETIEDEAVFFTSQSQVAKVAGISGSSVVKHISLLTFLGFIEKPAFNNIPEHMKEKALKYTNNGKKSKVNFYVIPSITAELLEKAEERAKTAIEKGINIRNISMKNIEENLGKEEADRIYQNNRKTILKSMEARNVEELDLPF